MFSSTQDGGGSWNGEVVSNDPSGKIRGCTLQPAGDGEATTEWIISIDGDEADLGKFSEAIYKKITTDAKQQRFQGFRPGTIPPHLEPTYRAFTMDECARETVLEAMQQNNIRPFESARTDMEILDVRIPPPVKKKTKGGKRKKKTPAPNSSSGEEPEGERPAWRSFESMKEAIDAGWRPGQSFSFVAKNVKGQELKDESVSGSRPLGLTY